ncbi:hypothetical protein YB2330_006494 [Saitoella coloradoensis]
MSRIKPVTAQTIAYSTRPSSTPTSSKDDTSKPTPTSEPREPPKKKKLSDEELMRIMEEHSGDGGASGLEYEDGQASTMKRSVKNNMFSMENPVKEIGSIVHALTTTSSPDEQRETVRRYFTADAAFDHPYVLIEHGQNSRDYIEKIYQWYKVMSPEIKLTVHGVAWDERNHKLYIDAEQVFTHFFLPHIHCTVRLTSKITLRPTLSPSGTRYYISAQEDFYQDHDAVAFLPFYGQLFLKWMLLAGKRVAGYGCWYGAWVGSLVGWWRPSGDWKWLPGKAGARSLIGPALKNADKYL